MSNKRNQQSKQVTEQTANHTQQGSPASDPLEKDSIISAEDNIIYNLKIIG